MPELLKRNAYTVEEAFNKIVIRSSVNGNIRYECPLDMWACSGNITEETRVKSEAYHYFFQYLKDGEYESFFEQDTEL